MRPEKEGVVWMERLPRRWQNLETIETKRKAMHDSRREGKLQEVFPVSLGKTGRQLEREKGFNCLVILWRRHYVFQKEWPCWLLLCAHLFYVCLNLHSEMWSHCHGMTKFVTSKNSVVFLYDPFNIFFKEILWWRDHFFMILSFMREIMNSLCFLEYAPFEPIC